MAVDPTTPMAKECMVRLKSSDDKIFEVDYAVAMQSQMLKNALGDTGKDSTVLLPSIYSEVQAKLIEYCEYHVNATNTISKKDVKMWDQEFVKHMDEAFLCHLIMAAEEEEEVRREYQWVFEKEVGHEVQEEVRREG